MISKHRKEIKLSEMITPKFHDLYNVWNSNEYLRHICKGGRGSAKSTNIGIILVLSLMKDPVNIICFRKVAETLRKSVYEQIKWAIDYLEVGEYFKFQVSPLEITYLERGNKFLFLGVDDPQKIKSIKTSQFPIAYYWFEELSEYKTEDEVETVIQSVLRGILPKGLKYKGFFSYNPPKMKHSWVNKKYGFGIDDKNIYIHHSTYLDNPYTSNEFTEDAERTRKENDIKYKHIYLGEPVGNGIVPFPNLVIREITDEEIKTFDKFRNGLDWGYGPDPLAFVRWAYVKKKRRIYALDEYYGVKRKIRHLAEYILRKGYDEIVTCDNSEPRSIDELREYDIPAIAAKKGKGSVEHGEKWLGDLEEIVIDRKRTPNIAREFEMIDYDIDKDGNPLPRLVDKNNHTVDGTRYGFENDMRKGKYIYDI